MSFNFKYLNRKFSLFLQSSPVNVPPFSLPLAPSPSLPIPSSSGDLRFASYRKLWLLLCTLGPEKEARREARGEASREGWVEGGRNLVRKEITEDLVGESENWRK